MDSQKLPQPLYPTLPSCFKDLLPDNISRENVDQHCVCWNCAPKLWEALSANKHNVRFFPLIDRDDEVSWAQQALYKSCDIRAVLKFMLGRLTKLRKGTLTTVQREAMRDLEAAKQELLLVYSGQRSWNDMPRLSTIAKPIDTIFFSNAISEACDYHWVTHLPGDRGDPPQPNEDYGCHVEFKREARQARIIVTPLGHPQIDSGFRYKPPQVRWERLLGTLLHEMVHALLSYYVCNGECHHGDRDVAKLCAYLFARTSDLFEDVVVSNGQLRQIGKYSGHGPCFQVLCRSLTETIRTVLEIDLPRGLGTIITTCECEQPSRCLSHCCESYLEMQYKSLKYCKPEDTDT